MAIVNTSSALFAGVTFGISFAVYVSLVISEHLNNIMMGVGNPFTGIGEIDMGSILITVPPGTYLNLSIIIFVVFIIHSFIMAFYYKNIER